MLELPQSTLQRLSTQLDALDLLLDGLSESDMHQRPEPGKWSVHEHLAHLGRYHEVFLMRLERILIEEAPALGRYRAEDDPEFSSWTALNTDQVLQRLYTCRRNLNDFLVRLPPAELARQGVHPKLGIMAVPWLVEFFLLHEAHHLYAILWLVRGTAGQYLQDGDIPLGSDA